LVSFDFFFMCGVRTADLDLAGAVNNVVTSLNGVVRGSVTVARHVDGFVLLRIWGWWVLLDLQVVAQVVVGCRRCRMWSRERVEKKIVEQLFEALRSSVAR
jgi:hypothetical protein